MHKLITAFFAVLGGEIFQYLCRMAEQASRSAGGRYLAHPLAVEVSLVRVGWIELAAGVEVLRGAARRGWLVLMRAA